MGTDCSGIGRMKTGRWRGLVRLIPLLCGLVLFAGCKTGPASWDFSIKNPFKSKVAADGRKAKKEGPEFASQLTQGRNMEKAGKYPEARKLYQKLIVAHPDRFESYHRLGVVADRQKRYREAQALYAQAIRREPRNAELFNDLGYSLFLQGKLEKAEIAMLKAVALSPSDSKYRNNLGMVLAHMDRYEEALAEFRRAGSDADAFYNLAFVLTAKNRDADATDCFRLALAADPDHEASRQALESSGAYNKSSDALAENRPLAGNEGRWIPYSESADSATGVRQTTMESPLNATASSSPVHKSWQATDHNRPALVSRRIERGGYE